MAAVGELVQWLKSRRLRRKKKDKTQTESSVAITPKLASRSGMALPPVPPGNWPDISRDCARSPCQEDIYAYAIDTRLDIIRDAHIPFLKNDDETTQSFDQEIDQSQSRSTTGSEDNHQHRTCSDRQIPQDQPKSCQRRIPPHESERIPRQESTTRIPRMKTLWPQARDDQDCSPASEGSDQLDRWVPVQGDFSSLSIHDRPTQPQRLQEQRMAKDVRRDHQTMPHGGRTKRSPIQQTYLSTSGHRPSHRQHMSCGDLDDIVFHEVANPQSDDSGVMSPSHSPLGVVHEWDHPAKDNQSTHLSNHGDGLSTRARLYIYTPYPDTRDQPAATSTPTELGYHGDHHDSTDTYNEYDGSEPEAASTDQSVQLEYLFYLRKTDENLQKTRGVQNIVRASTSPASDSSLDLTSVTELSDVSNFFTEKPRGATKKHHRSQKTLPPRPKTKSRSSDMVHTRQVSSQQSGSATSPRKATKSSSQSAFKPFKSQSLMHLNTASMSEVPKDPKEMSLQERLSCRVTTGIPAGLRTVSRTQTSHAKRARPVSSLVTMATTQGPNTSRNSVLSDVIRINYDRQILRMY